MLTLTGGLFVLEHDLPIAPAEHRLGSSCPSSIKHNPETIETRSTYSVASLFRPVMKRINWPIWVGFLLSVVAAFSYPVLFVQWRITREFPWVNLILFAVAVVLLFVGLRRAFKPENRVVSKIFSSLAATLGVLLFAMLMFVIYVMGAWLPTSSAAPQVGQKAPDITLVDSNNRVVTLANLLTEPINNKPPKGVLLIFYRGYW